MPVTSGETSVAYFYTPHSSFTFGMGLGLGSRELDFLPVGKFCNPYYGSPDFLYVPGAYPYCLGNVFCRGTRIGHHSFENGILQLAQCAGKPRSEIQSANLNCVEPVDLPARPTQWSACGFKAFDRNSDSTV